MITCPFVFIASMSSAKKNFSSAILDSYQNHGYARFITIKGLSKTLTFVSILLNRVKCWLFAIKDHPLSKLPGFLIVIYLIWSFLETVLSGVTLPCRFVDTIWPIRPFHQKPYKCFYCWKRQRVENGCHAFDV